MTQQEKFQSAVEQLTPGNRHGFPLASAAAFGVRCGYDDGQIMSYIMDNAPGEKRPDPQQVKDAIKYASNLRMRPTVTIEKLGQNVFSPHKGWEKEIRPNLPNELKSFASSLISKGRGRIVNEFLGNLPSRQLSAIQQSEQQLLALGYSDNQKVWAGDIGPVASTGKGGKRDFHGSKNGIFTIGELIAEIRKTDEIPTHISLNPQSGLPRKNKDGRRSYDCLATVSAFCNALIEFDLLPLDEQLYFLAGLLKWSSEHGDLFNVRHAVYSGGKSIHIVLRITADSQKDYAKAWRCLMKLFASSDDPGMRIDITNAFTGGNATTHTRLAGAIRRETGLLQRLLYLGPTI